MKKYLLKFLILFLLCLLPNIIIGFVRIYFGDENIAYLKNKKQNHLVYNFEEQDSFTKIKTYAITDLSRDTLGEVNLTYDYFGFTNQTENNKPEILFIGDSFFRNIINPTDSSIQARGNNILKRNACYNIGSSGNSTFKVYNELLEREYLHKPKIIVLEIVERYLTDWLDLKNQLENSLTKTNRGNFGLDFVFGNNFYDFGNFKTHSPTKDLHQGTPHYINKRKVYFLKDQLSHLNKNQIDSLIINLKYAHDFFKKENIKIHFVIVPDKESVYPKMYGVSQLSEIQKHIKENNLPFIDLYSEFIKDPLQFYVDGDTHWNNRGIALFFDLLKEKGIFKL